MTRLAFLFPFVLACSSAPPASQNDSGIPEGDAAAAVGSDADAAIQQKDAAIVTDAALDVDAASDPLVPHPPAGSTKCGAGTIDSASAHTACTEPSWILDDMLQIDGGQGAMPRACDALTIGAGEWQAWCTTTSTYLWARIPINNAGTMQDCHGTSLLMIDEGIWQYGNGGGNGGASIATYESNGTEIAGTVPGDPQTLVASMIVQTDGQNQAATMWIAGSIEDTCNNAIFDPPTVLTGFDATWK
ncbi:MAG TPA: hypothetical protein VH054_28950 [Polyangiaceae bacterium]|nr:hypothetical protein [Polyangiaceae bacterium]